MSEVCVDVCIDCNYSPAPSSVLQLGSFEPIAAKYKCACLCVCVCVCSFIYLIIMLYRGLASGSGDCTVRLWDSSTETPHHVCKGVYSIVCTVYMC